MTITELVKASHDNAVAKGFYGDDGKGGRNIGELLMLIVSELGEALEADRKYRHINIRLWDQVHVYDLNPGTNPQFPFDFETHVKDTFEDEIADTFIRLADMCGYMNIDIQAHIDAKMKYNSTREKLHGKKY